MPYESRAVSVCLVGTGTMPSLTWAGTLLPLILLGGSFPAAGNSPPACASEYSAEYLSRSPEFSLYATLSPLWYSATSSLFGLPRLSALSLQFRESAGLHLDSPSLYHSLKTLKTVILGNHRSHLICFHFLKDYCLSLPDVQCLENSCFIQGVRQRSF